MADETSKYVSLHRDCRYGHGPLSEVAGYWALRGVEFSGDGRPMGGQGAFGVGLMVCNTCGYVELFDKELPRASS